MLAQKEPDRTKEQEIAKLHNVARFVKFFWRKIFTCFYKCCLYSL